ncbi:polyphosphate--glucose phosphotransferase [Lewinella sp. 4G2]|uniref:polyphosphate--glucose phosphotransferase n=1 Tax=Lewinella sp. 4G2 TaxID=1803372 RepID=UPI0007B4DE94|nr:ROK family protein [Lewinella sp. 4G2]OAV43398.1 polyphosphate glucokinase [Lewinella sp. 4G2]
MQQNVILGIDVGATGIKGGLVDVVNGKMLTERHRFDTPSGGKPKDMAKVVKKLVDHFEYEGAVGVGFPAVVRRGTAASAANIDDAWIGTNIEQIFAAATGNRFFALNDADAAGIASMRFGIGQPFMEDGTVLMITIGTGLGGALFVDGELMPNLEIGQIFLRNQKVIAEKFISNKVRRDNDMGWKEFGKKFNKVLSHVDGIFNPDLIILGGGASKHFLEYQKYLKAYADVKPAKLMNTAGTIGAALYAGLKVNK